MTAATAVLASLALVSAALPLKPELEIRRRIARDTPTAVASSAGADELQRLADAAVAEPGRTLVLEKGRTYRLTRPLRLDARHSGLTIEGNARCLAEQHVPVRERLRHLRSAGVYARGSAAPWA